jgi:hypothetical protein
MKLHGNILLCHFNQVADYVNACTTEMHTFHLIQWIKALYPLDIINPTFALYMSMACYEAICLPMKKTGFHFQEIIRPLTLNVVSLMLCF